MHISTIRGCGAACGLQDLVMECKEFSTGNVSGFEIFSSTAFS